MTALSHPNALLGPASRDAEHGAVALAHVAARLASPVARHLHGLANCHVDVVATTGTATFGAWQRPSALGFAYRIGSACAVSVSVDGGVAAALIQRQFGGASSGAPPRPAGQCRATAALGRDIAGGVVSAIADAWPGGKLTDVAASVDTAQFARADDTIATITLVLPLLGEIRIAFAIEGVARISGAPVPPRIADWSGQLRSSAFAARLPVRAILARPEFPAATVIRLSVGDVLPITKPASVPLYAGAYRLGMGALTETDGRTTVQIQMMESLCDD